MALDAEFMFPSLGGKGSLPHITTSMLEDGLGDQAILMRPPASNRRQFRWTVNCTAEDSSFIDENPLSPANLLLVAEASDIPALLERFPSIFAVTQARSQEELDALSVFDGRLLVLEPRESFTRLILTIQDFFLRTLLWESELDRIVMKRGSLNELLDASTDFLGNFIFMSDNDFNVIARTSDVVPPDDLHRGIIENGCLTSRAIAEKRFRLPEKMFYTRKASDITPYDRVSFPIHINHNYFGSISMSCNNTPDTPGLRDAFLSLARRISIVCERMWLQQTAYDTPSYFFFTKLLRGDPMTDEYFAAQLDMSGVEGSSLFKLLVYDVDPSINPSLAQQIARAATWMNGGSVKCFPHENAVVALCYQKDNNDDGMLSHHKTTVENQERIFGPFNVTCGSSSVFNDLRNLNLAYRQARIALGFRGAIDREHQSNDEEQPHPGTYYFEDALIYYLVDPTGKDEEFIEFAFSTSIARALWKEDLENGTNYLGLLWIYLQNERNATATGKHMHMHRNTVLYHIEKLEHRFDFSLSSKSARDWLLLSIKSLFLSQSNESLKTIFKETRSEAPSSALATTPEQEKKTPPPLG